MAKPLTPDSFSTIIEPFKIKTVEPIRTTSRDERATFLKEAGYNLDAARFAENAMFVKMREPGNAGRTPRRLVYMTLAQRT